MILCFLLNVYWKFNLNELDEKIKNSFSMPLFVVCYVPSCKKCTNIKSEFNDFISISGNRTDMYTSMINCLVHEDFCKYLDVPITPISYLIIGNNSRYWPKTYSNQAEDWISFVDKYVNSNLKKIDYDNKKQLNHIIQKSTDNGGVTYYLVVKNSRDDILRKIRRTAYHYLVYNVSFVYSINENIENAEITRFYTKNYSEKFNGDLHEAEKFIEEVQFGPIHKYDYKEWKRQKSPKLFLFTNQNYILDSQKEGLIKLEDKFHRNISIGWVSMTEESSRQFFNDFPLTDLPISIIYDNINSTSYCYFLTKERTINIAETKFVENFFEQKLICNQTLDDSNITLNDSPKKSIAMKSKMIISGKKFLIIYISCGLIIIGLLRLKQNDDDEKEE